MPHTALGSKTGTSSINLDNVLVSLSLKNSPFALEGNFDDYFSIETAIGYEKDILYLFTPDVMNELAHEKLFNHDIEFIDDYMYVYSSSKFNLENIIEIEDIFLACGRVVQQLNEQLVRYEDERSEVKNKIALQGSRITDLEKVKRNAKIYAIIVVIVVLFIGALLSLFLRSPQSISI